MDAKLDFEKMNGLLPAVVQDGRDGEVLMVGFMNREAFEQTLARLRDVLQPYPQRAVDERREFGQPVESGLGADGLRSATRCCCGWKSKGREWSAIAGRGRASRKQFHVRMRSVRRVGEGRRDEAAHRNSQGQLAGGDAAVVRAGRACRIYERALVLRDHCAIRKSIAC